MDTEQYYYRWAPIEDLPSNWESLRLPELASFAPIWVQELDQLKESAALKEFLTKLKREWSIETGIIENTYTLTQGITTTLIEHGFLVDLVPRGATDKPPWLLINVLRDHEEVINGIFDFVAKRRKLSAAYIRELHQVFTRNQETTEAVDQFGTGMELRLEKGTWKKLPNNPTRPDGLVHEYCPPVQVDSEIQKLVALHDSHLAGDVPPEVEAAWLHHRFTQIHPFQDGNGRVGRALASLVLVQAQWFPLVIPRDKRADYLDSLESADNGDLGPLVQLFSQRQLLSMRQAVSLADTVLAERPAYQTLILSATERLGKRREQRNRSMLMQAEETTKALKATAYQILTGIAHQVTLELKALHSGYFSDVQEDSEENSYWFKYQIIQVARNSGYFADTSTYRSWIRLRIRWERQAELVLSFHSLGQSFIGVMAVSAFLLYKDLLSKDPDQEEPPALPEPIRLTEDIFQFSYDEDREKVATRFTKWVEDALFVALRDWRESI